MGETCFHIPARVFGFESSAAEAGQTRQAAQVPSPSSKASLLSRLLKDNVSSQMPVTYMEDAYSDDSDDEMDGDSGEEADADLGAEDGSIPIPPTSEAWLKQQREAHERFVYAVQIEEMRRQCAAYFARLHRVGASTASNDSNNVNTNATTGSSGSTIPQQTSRPAKPGPGF